MKRHLLIFRLLAGLVVSIMVLVSNVSITMAYEKEIKTISSSIAESVTAAGKKTVAVVDFTDLQGNVTELGRFLAEEISVDMTVAAKGFEVIDRTHLNSVMKEHELSMLGITDPKKIKKLGEVSGVDAIVTGSVTPFGDSIRITCKVIATDTARTIGASKGDIAKTKAIEELLARGINTTISNASTTPSTSQETKTGEKKESVHAWDNGEVRVTIESLIKTGKTVTIQVLYENITEKNIKINYDWHQAHLLDEDGGRWNYINNSDTAQVWGTREILPGKKIRSKMSFGANTSEKGSIFDFFMRGTLQSSLGNTIYTLLSKT